jgi:phosphatidylinositol glycan class O
MKPSSRDPPPQQQSGGQEYQNIKAQWANAQLLAEEEARQRAAAAVGQPSRRHGAASESELLEEMKKADTQKKNEVKEREFKVRHLGIMVLLGWVL